MSAEIVEDSSEKWTHRNFEPIVVVCAKQSICLLLEEGLQRRVPTAGVKIRESQFGTEKSHELKQIKYVQSENFCPGYYFKLIVAILYELQWLRKSRAKGLKTTSVKLLGFIL